MQVDWTGVLTPSLGIAEVMASGGTRTYPSLFLIMRFMAVIKRRS